MNGMLVSIFNAFLRDSDSVLDGIPFDLRDAAVKKGMFEDPLLIAFYPDTQLEEAISQYAMSNRMNSLTAAQRWCFAMRLKFAAGFLRPFTKKEIRENSPVFKWFDGLGKPEVIETLLLDLPHIFSSVVSDYLTLNESLFCSPVRPPWDPKTQISRVSPKDTD